MTDANETDGTDGIDLRDIRDVVAHRAQTHRICSVMGGQLAIVDAPEPIDGEYVLADPRGNFLPLHPGEVGDYLALFEAFGEMEGGADFSVATLGEVDHDCPDHCYPTGIRRQADGNLSIQNTCRKCGAEIEFRYTMTQVVDSEGRGWAPEAVMETEPTISE